jgi:alpha/beta superfamily hydrolase
MLGVDTVTLLQKENKNSQIITISNTDHSFLGKQKELVSIVENFVIKNKLNVQSS